MNGFARRLEKHPELAPCLADIERAYQFLSESFSHQGKLLLCGNGGSAADCEHIVGELMKGFYLKRPLSRDALQKLAEGGSAEGTYLGQRLQGALPAISLVSQVGLNTAIGNDIAADLVFAQQVHGYGRPGDVLFAISTSGNSASILYAARTAHALGLKTIGLTGWSGGRLKDLCDAAICVPYQQTSEIQEAHMVVYHALCAALEEEFFS